MLGKALVRSYSPALGNKFMLFATNSFQPRSYGLFHTVRSETQDSLFGDHEQIERFHAGIPVKVGGGKSPTKESQLCWKLGWKRIPYDPLIKEFGPGNVMFSRHGNAPEMPATGPLTLQSVQHYFTTSMEDSKGSQTGFVRSFFLHPK